MVYQQRGTLGSMPLSYGFGGRFKWEQCGPCSIANTGRRWIGLSPFSEAAGIRRTSGCFSLSWPAAGGAASSLRSFFFISENTPLALSASRGFATNSAREWTGATQLVGGGSEVSLCLTCCPARWSLAHVFPWGTFCIPCF